ncbi:autotransporter outer membrane beta-barrel domain-containing protein [Bartonella rattaustraliani]|uniref:autotransporter outer membrane beta-barrel domain-containing protein n=1 Tax=Bartonella rattaustraliani TaxID=481139 RepID=UPI001FCB2900|nr:autotransporter outer membrane beta-barrel domain-containing protein [Bartonella rattaustraliani]
MRIRSYGSLKQDENVAFFARSYGGHHHYTSDLSAFEYGYRAAFDYAALEEGGVLKEIESLYKSASFGIMGTYGRFSFQLKMLIQSEKSTFDKWTVAVYGSLKHYMGFYMDGVLSYGLFKGDVLILA